MKNNRMNDPMQPNNSNGTNWIVIGIIFVVITVFVATYFYLNTPTETSQSINAGTVPAGTTTRPNQRTNGAVNNPNEMRGNIPSSSGSSNMPSSSTAPNTNVNPNNATSTTP